MGIIAERWLAGESVQIDVQRATGVARLCGLIVRGAPPPGCALLIPRCRSVHTLGMREPLDVVFLRHGRVLRVNRLVPHRLAVCPAADAVLELSAGEAARLGLASGVVLNRLEKRRELGHRAREL